MRKTNGPSIIDRNDKNMRKIEPDINPPSIPPRNSATAPLI